MLLFPKHVCMISLLSHGLQWSTKEAVHTSSQSTPRLWYAIYGAFHVAYAHCLHDRAVQSTLRIDPMAQDVFDTILDLICMIYSAIKSDRWPEIILEFKFKLERLLDSDLDAVWTVRLLMRRSSCQKL